MSASTRWWPPVRVPSPAGAGRGRDVAARRSARRWRTPASSWTRSPPTCWASRAGRCWAPWSPANATGRSWPSWPEGRLRTKLPQLRQALRGRFGDHHALLVGLALDHQGAPGRRHRRPGRPHRRGDRPVRGGPGPARRPSPGSASAPPRPDRRDRRRHDRVPDRRAPGKPGGPLPRQQRHRGQTPLGQADQGNRWLAEVLTWVRLGRCHKPRHLAIGPAAGGWPGASASSKAAVAVGHFILVICWMATATTTTLAATCFIRRDRDRARQRAVAQPQALGYQVTLQIRRLTPGDSRFRTAVRRGAAYQQLPRALLGARQFCWSWYRD
jgi:hypothetical protein